MPRVPASRARRNQRVGVRFPRGAPTPTWSDDRSSHRRAPHGMTQAVRASGHLACSVRQHRRRRVVVHRPGRGDQLPRELGLLATSQATARPRDRRSPRSTQPSPEPPRTRRASSRSAPAQNWVPPHTVRPASELPDADHGTPREDPFEEPPSSSRAHSPQPGRFPRGTRPPAQ